ncbi:predicted protein [Botrytis cinerea T4]|uniref:Uncharacterized protein n=1 Tax=Botryotinia fuckeliana (strain T4) TaxID=999810 RepID=G2Y4C0_BOTF4|nr:predicted protein [Botrytis cinerea T4]
MLESRKDHGPLGPRFVEAVRSSYMCDDSSNSAESRR